ncbi:MAG: polyphosphate kinase 2 family protein [Kiritimatiellae bacterium]|nr:polyphosphate kinase 2 family protein [Kiritimatiellia bacterium]
MRALKKLVADCRVTSGREFKLKDHRPDRTGSMDDKDAAAEWMSRGLQELREQQDRLYADDRWSLLLIFQAMDAAGKDGTIKHVMSGVNPQGCQVFSFKTPSAEEMDHDFLWRATCRLPERGRIGIFNRSYYEETLVVRVHPGFLDRQKLPEPCRTPNIWRERFEDIVHFEQYLSRQGTVIRKFFLHVSKEEQRERFLDRIERPDKNWKFSTADVDEREYWDEYQNAFEDMIRHTATPQAPWYVIPADRKWLARILVAAVVVETLKSLKLEYPALSKEQQLQLKQAKARLRTKH